MLGWVSSWWSVGSFPGPARNAPNNGIDIKKLFDQRPTQVISLSEADVKQELKKLRPTITNAVPPISNKPPLMQEFDDVFNKGYKDYFEVRKRKRIEVQIVNFIAITAVNAAEISCDSDIVSQLTFEPQPDVIVPEILVISIPIDSSLKDDVISEPSFVSTSIDTSSTDSS